MAGNAFFGVDRRAPLSYLPEATRFSGEDDLCDPQAIVAFIAQRPALVDALERGFGLRFNPDDPDDDRARWQIGPAHRPCMPGSWPLLFLAYTLGGVTSIQHWYTQNQQSGLFARCGFATVPSYQTVRRHFIALEAFLDRDASDGTKLPDGFTLMARMLIEGARTVHPEIGRAVMTDATAVATRAALVHSCPPNTACGKRQAARAGRAHETNAPVKAGHGSRVRRASIDAVNDTRHAEAEHAPEDETAAVLGDKRRPLVALDEAFVAGAGLDPSMRWWAQDDTKGVTHYYCCLDASVGCRRYGAKKGGKGKFWNGWLHAKMVDTFTGATMAVDIYPADEQEYERYPHLLNALRDQVGGYPQIISGDRGIATKDVYALNTRHGIGSVLPWRGPRQVKHRRELEDHVVDRHGVPRCRHCGSEGITTGSGLGFTLFRGTKPAIRFTCALGLTPACKGRIQRVACDHEPRLLQPLQLDDAVYHQARQAHDHFERVHLHERQRYMLAGREVAVQTYRLGAQWQRLRAHAAIALDWLRMSIRQGWLGARRTRRANKPLPGPTLREDGGRLAKVLAARARHALGLPYGPKAAALGIGFHDPPWKTAQRAP